MLDNMTNLTDSQKRILVGITTYLNEEELDKFADYSLKHNISVIESLQLDDISISDEKIYEKLRMLRRYV